MNYVYSVILLYYIFSSLKKHKLAKKLNFLKTEGAADNFSTVIKVVYNRLIICSFS